MTFLFRELYLDGNNLQCEGATELIKLCVDQAEVEASQREEEVLRKAEEEALRLQEGEQWEQKLHCWVWVIEQPLQPGPAQTLQWKSNIATLSALLSLNHISTKVLGYSYVQD